MSDRLPLCVVHSLKPSRVSALRWQVGPSCQADGDSGTMSLFFLRICSTTHDTASSDWPWPDLGAMALLLAVLCAQPSFLRYQVICLRGLLSVRIMQGIIILVH